MQALFSNPIKINFDAKKLIHLKFWNRIYYLFISFAIKKTKIEKQKVKLQKSFSWQKKKKKDCLWVMSNDMYFYIYKV